MRIKWDWYQYLGFVRPISNEDYNRLKKLMPGSTFDDSVKADPNQPLTKIDVATGGGGRMVRQIYHGERVHHGHVLATNGQPSQIDLATREAADRTSLAFWVTTYHRLYEDRVAVSNGAWVDIRQELVKVNRQSGKQAGAPLISSATRVRAAYAEDFLAAAQGNGPGTLAQMALLRRMRQNGYKGPGFPEIQRWPSDAISDFLDRYLITSPATVQRFEENLHRKFRNQPPIVMPRPIIATEMTDLHLPREHPESTTVESNGIAVDVPGTWWLHPPYRKLFNTRTLSVGLPPITVRIHVGNASTESFRDLFTDRGFKNLVKPGVSVDSALVSTTPNGRTVYTLLTEFSENLHSYQHQDGDRSCWVILNMSILDDPISSIIDSIRFISDPATTVSSADGLDAYPIRFRLLEPWEKHRSQPTAHDYVMTKGKRLSVRVVTLSRVFGTEDDKIVRWANRQRTIHRIPPVDNVTDLNLEKLKFTNLGSGGQYLLFDVFDTPISSHAKLNLNHNTYLYITMIGGDMTPETLRKSFRKLLSTFEIGQIP